MVRPLVLRVDAEPSGGWRVALGPPGAAASRGRLDVGVVQTILAAAASALRADPVSIPGRADRVEQRELKAGQALARSFESAALSWVMGEQSALARSRQQPLLVALDCSDAEIAALPWELLAGGPETGFLEEGTGAVGRLGVGLSAPVLDAARLRLLVWCPTPADPTCADALSALALIDGVEHLSAGADLRPVLPASEPETADLLVLLCHGAALEGGTSLAIDGRHAGPALALPADLRARGGVAAVVLGVCEGGVASAVPAADLASRLLLQGAPAVVSSPVPIRTESLLEFTRGLVQSLLEEAPLAVAAQVGRRNVARLLESHPDSRPWAFQLRAATVETLAARCVRRRWRPDGWPSVAPDLGDLLAAAHARAARAGWFGLEHLLEVWPRTGSGVVGQLGAILAAEMPALLPALRSGLVRGPEGEVSALPCSPRVRRLGAALPSARATLHDLATALLEDPTSPLLALAPRPLASITWDPRGSAFSLPSAGLAATPDGPAVAFSVLWGPEDGRRIAPAEGDTVGRWHQHGQDPHRLYEGCPVIDRDLRRGHLRFVEAGRVELLHGARWTPRGQGWRRATEIRGDLALRGGDLILLSEGTWLLGLAP